MRLHVHDVPEGPTPQQHEHQAASHTGRREEARPKRMLRKWLRTPSKESQAAAPSSAAPPCPNGRQHAAGDAETETLGDFLRGGQTQTAIFSLG